MGKKVKKRGYELLDLQCLPLTFLPFYPISNHLIRSGNTD